MSRWTLPRRFLVLVALMFWQGGFTFYAGVVVPVGRDVLGSEREQGFITREVTRYLNLSGGIALAVLGWDAVATADRSRLRRWTRLLAWAGMAAALVWLVWLHPRLDALLDPEASRILDRKAFRSGHRLYLWISTVQWGLGIVYAGMTLAAWRAEDRGNSRLGPSPERERRVD
jgi:hypothetical protein